MTAKPRDGAVGSRPNLGMVLALVRSGPSPFPVGSADPVEHVTAQRTRGDARMVEVLRWVAGHADALHHVLRAHVAGRREGDDFVEPDGAESRCQCCVCGLGRIAMTPG